MTRYDDDKGGEPYRHLIPSLLGWVRACVFARGAVHRINWTRVAVGGGMFCWNHPKSSTGPSNTGSLEA